MTMPELEIGLPEANVEADCLSNSKSPSDLLKADTVMCPNADDVAVNGDSCVCDVNQSSTSSIAHGNGSEPEVQVGEKIVGSVEGRGMAVASGLWKSERFLPFLVGSPKLDACLICQQFICPGEEVSCSAHNCRGAYHLHCAKKKFRFSNTKKFKCPQHACPICRKAVDWQCIYCPMASHDKCAPWPEAVIHIPNQPKKAICWRHPSHWWEDELETWATEYEDIFRRLRLPCIEEEFKINMAWKDEEGPKVEPPQFLHIKKNIYIVKKKRDNVNDGLGCANCHPSCSENCVCRVQYVSCSRACRCSAACTNKPFRKEKKIKIIQTEHCGWGVESVGSIDKGEFIIEYIGEVIDDALCEKRLWDMKDRGTQNFYMCEISKDFTIDATFKGNASRFLNHSCDPNCLLEKWQVDGETRVGIFAGRSIKAGEQLTYDYRFVQFGPEVKCKCGSSKCQGYLGMKRKNVKIGFSWGVKRRRSKTVCLAVVT
uniref:Uncharacterized protein n=1 Tax=Kalanchoe fedtschenkoi TaxID=63787 RepID=A0A7N0SWX1_KALFE